jgi:hypothetical protein
MKYSRPGRSAVFPSALTLLIGTGTALAVEVSAPYVELPVCDAHEITLSHELGNPPAPPFGPTGPFPPEEAIVSDSLIQNLVECSAGIADPGAPDYLVKIDNLTSTKWVDLFFVADLENLYNNHDGTILGGLAMKIDTIGLNTPLVLESLTPDLVFEPGETWIFEVLDWIGPSPPHLFDSIGVGFASVTFPPSTASIVANPIPLPAALWLLAGTLAGVPALGRRRS